MKSYAEQKFLQLMNDYGHDVLVLHHSTETPCSCYDRVTGSADRTCQYCFGMGYVPSVARYTTRQVDGSVSDTVPRSGNVQSFGAMVVENKHYYFHKEVPVKEQDLIIEVEWKGIKPIYNGGSIFEVDHVHPFRYEKGQVLYKKASVKDKPVNKQIRGIKIVKKAGEVSYQLAERK